MSSSLSRTLAGFHNCCTPVRLSVRRLCQRNIAKGSTLVSDLPIPIRLEIGGNGEASFCMEYGLVDILLE